MRKLIILIALIALIPSVVMATGLKVVSDKNCYLTGERLQVSLCIGNDDQSRVAYVEIADSAHLYAQTMVQMEAGRGWGVIALPQSMHSGNYTLTAYTRQMLKEGAQPDYHVISVVNVGHVTRADQITFLQPDSAALPIAYRTYKAGERLEAIAPAETEGARMLTFTMARHDLQTPDYSSYQTTYQLPDTPLPLEYEGHVVSSRVVGKHNINEGFLSRVGREASLFEGHKVSDDRMNFYTRGLNGRVAASLTAVTYEGNTVPLEFVSPYAKLLPHRLPALQVACSEEQLRERSLTAQREEMLVQQTDTATNYHSAIFMGDEPDKVYDLDEWRRFSSVREIIIEFLSAVHRHKDNGVNFLYIYDPATKQLSKLSALVLLDGMPIYDIDRFLEYDARLLKYVQIYYNNYVFGDLLYHGVISFTSIRGRLANFKLEAGTQLVTYQFPQNRPAFESIGLNTAGTLYWNPDVAPASTLLLSAPAQPGLYLMHWQWVDDEGKVMEQKGYIEVKG